MWKREVNTLITSVWYNSPAEPRWMQRWSRSDGLCFNGHTRVVIHSPALAVSVVFCSMRKRISLTASSMDVPNTSKAPPEELIPSELSKQGEELGLSSNRTGERSVTSGTASCGSSICCSPLQKIKYFTEWLDGLCILSCCHIYHKHGTRTRKQSLTPYIYSTTTLLDNYPCLWQCYERGSDVFERTLASSASFRGGL